MLPIPGPSSLPLSSLPTSLLTFLPLLLIHRHDGSQLHTLGQRSMVLGGARPPRPHTHSLSRSLPRARAAAAMT